MTEPDSPPPSSTTSSVHDQSLRSLLDDRRSTPNTLSPSPIYTTSKRLHIANIPYKWVDSDLEQLFSPYGAVTHVEIVCNERGSKGFGFVTFLDATAADLAMLALSGKEFLGRTIAVNEASRRRRPLSDPSRATVWQRATTNQGSEQTTADFAALLLKQKQLLAQQQLQQFLITQQQTDMIATALGLPTSNLGGLLAGSLPYTATAIPGLTIDPLALQLQSMQHQQQLLQPVTAIPPMQQYATYGQGPTVSNYSMPLGAAGLVRTEVGQQQQQQSSPLNHPSAMYIANEITHSTTSTTKGRSATFNGQRFNPY